MLTHNLTPGAVASSRHVTRAICVSILIPLLPWAEISAQLRPEVIARTGIPTVARVVTYTTEGEPLLQGTGFLVDAAGRVVTNAHVVRGASRIDVELVSGRTTHAAKLLAYEPNLDLAVLKIPGSDVNYLALSDRGRPAVGSSVYVIGNPLGLDRTFSDGLVSGWRKRGGETLMQITAPISPGSSGGPVVGPDGKVVGVATATLVEGQNINLAVPVEYVRAILAKSPDEGLALPVTTADDSAERATSPAGELVAELRSYPLRWTVDDVKQLLGTPADISQPTEYTNMMYIRKLYGVRGFIDVYINPSTQKSFGGYTYFTSLEECSMQFDGVRSDLTKILGRPVRIADSKGACNNATVRWDDPKYGRSFLLMVSRSLRENGPARQRFRSHTSNLVNKPPL